MLITGTRKGIGRHLAEHYADKGFQVFGCSRGAASNELKNYRHFCLDVTDEEKVRSLFAEIRQSFGKLDVLINNAGVASMNHTLLTPLSAVNEVMNTNFTGTFLFCREGAKLMKKNGGGRIVNLSTVATPLKLEGEAIYASSKAAVVTLTEILARELSSLGITVNAVGPTPTKTDLIKVASDDQIKAILERQAIKRFTEMTDITNVIDFFILPDSDFVTGQVVYLGGI